MKQQLVLVFLALILVALVPVQALAGEDTHRIEFRKDVVVNGVSIAAGKYKLVLSEEGAEIYAKNELIVKAEVEVLPLGDLMPNTVSADRDGGLIEIRLKKSRVLFVKS